MAEPKPRILVADDDVLLAMMLREVLEAAGYHVTVAANGDELVRHAQTDVPDLLLVDLMMPLVNGYEAIRQLRNDTRTAHLPMIILTARSASAEVISGFDSGADDYIVKPYDTDVLLARIRSHLRRAAQLPVRNPLTGLPGNVLLQSEIQHLLSKQQLFYLLYVDLDNFKAFNDAYGFSRGDRAIHLLADVLTRTAAASDFIGHIGGDDFAIIHYGSDVEQLCQKLIQAFDAQVRQLYDPEDLKRGYLKGIDRRGVVRHFSLLSLSIAVVSTAWRRFSSVDDLSKAAAELKSAAKIVSHSSYEIDRRRDQQPPLTADRRGQVLPNALLICADQTVRTTLTAVLRGRGYRPLPADGILAAQSLLARDPEPALLIADLGIGRPLWRMWQALHGPPPLIGLTTSADAIDEVAARQLYSIVAIDEPIDRVVARFGKQLPPLLHHSAQENGSITPVGETGPLPSSLSSQGVSHMPFSSISNAESLTGFCHVYDFLPYIEAFFKTGQPLSIAMIDIDDFRSINARFTHHVGNAILKHIADILRVHCRPGDMIAHYGGEEFALILPGSALAETIVMCEQIRVAISQVDWSPINADLRVTISVGAAEHQGNDTADALLATAETRLHEAKVSGKNRVCA